MTRRFPSTLKHYESLLEDQPYSILSIELAPTDGVFVEKFRSPLPQIISNRKDMLYMYSPVEMTFYIKVGNNEAQEFSINETKTQDIVDYVEVANYYYLLTGHFNSMTLRLVDTLVAKVNLNYKDLANTEKQSTKPRKKDYDEFGVIID
ncbi:unnamed protein product [Rotaria socialis]